MEKLWGLLYSPGCCLQVSAIHGIQLVGSLIDYSYFLLMTIFAKEHKAGDILSTPTLLLANIDHILPRHRLFLLSFLQAKQNYPCLHMSVGCCSQHCP